MKLALLIFIILTFIGPLWAALSGQIDWHAQYQTANRDSAHIAPDPKTTPEAIIQVYSARAFNWRGLVASHNWIAIKNKNSQQYIVCQIVGWRKFYGLPPLEIEADLPDRYWYGQKPNLILDIRGEQAEKLIPEIYATAKTYPYANQYEIWPGPNSNTFPAFIGRRIPTLGLALPANAIGKDFLPRGKFFAAAPSGTGYQLSLSGIVGVLLAKKEGLEINLFGLVYGIRFSPFAIELPGITLF